MTVTAAAGLVSGQQRSADILSPETGWYDENGRRLGWGMLDHEDFVLIRRHLPQCDHRAFITVVNVWACGNGYPKLSDVWWLAEHALHIVTSKDFYIVKDDLFLYHYDAQVSIFTPLAQSVVESFLNNLIDNP